MNWQHMKVSKSKLSILYFKNYLIYDSTYSRDKFPCIFIFHPIPLRVWNDVQLNLSEYCIRVHKIDTV